MMRGPHIQVQIGFLVGTVRAYAHARVCAHLRMGPGDSLHLPALPQTLVTKALRGFAGFCGERSRGADLPHGGLILAAVGVAGQPGPYRPRALSAGGCQLPLSLVR